MLNVLKTLTCLTKAESLSKFAVKAFKPNNLEYISLKSLQETDVDNIIITVTIHEFFYLQ